jgi:predicted amidohydrolase YtcJ
MSLPKNSGLFSVVNARIFTANPAAPWLDSFTFQNGVVTSVNSGAAAGSTVIDLEGAFVSPSFGDGHAHPMFAGFEYFGPVLRELKTVAEIQQSVKRFAAANPELPWIIGGSYDSWIVENGEFDARWLDEVVVDRPVVLRATDYHTVWVNSKALEVAGIKAETPDPELGWILRRPDGSPLGTLREWDAVDLVMTEKIDALGIASEELAAAGITWVQDAWVDPGMPEAYLAAAEAGKLPIRFNLGLRANARIWREQLAWFGKTKADFEGHPIVSCNTIKFFADGVIEGHTAAITGGYSDDPHNVGMPCWDWPELHAAVAAVDALGFQVHIHAIGDEGLTQAINAIENSRRLNGVASHPRPVITHVQMLNPRDIARFAEFDIVANFEPLWACNDQLQRDLTTPHIGHERAAWQYPMKSILNAGATVSMGSDWPVTEYNPLACMEIAITRTLPDDPSSEPWLPQERLSVDEALTAYTYGVALQAGEESRWGSIRVGASADFVVLDSDIFEVEPGQIHRVAVAATYLAGKQIYRRK